MGCGGWPPRTRHDPPSWLARQAAVVRHLKHPTPKQVITGKLSSAQRCWSICPLIMLNESRRPHRKLSCRGNLLLGFILGGSPAQTAARFSTPSWLCFDSQRGHHRICLQGQLGGGHHAVFLQDAKMDSYAACNSSRTPGQGLVGKIWRDNHPGPRSPR